MTVRRVPCRARGALAVVALFAAAISPPATGAADAISGRNAQIALTIEYYYLNFLNELRLSATIDDKVAAAYGLDGERLVAALAKRTRAITDELNSNLDITTVDGDTFNPPDPPGTPPWPRFVHVNFNVSMDPEKSEVILVRFTLRRGDQYRPGRYYTGVKDPYEFNVRCAEADCLYARIVDGVEDALRIIVSRREGSEALKKHFDSLQQKLPADADR